MIIHDLPTGKLFIDDYSKGQLETLSIGDYGKSKNVKADFLGLTEEINGVPSDTPIMSMSEKWVITLSTQYGCAPMSCVFCDCPSIPFKGNATYSDLQNQFLSAIDMFPDVQYVERLNIHFARMGEPSMNQSVIDFARDLFSMKKFLQTEKNLRIEVIHPVFTTALPNRNDELRRRVLDFCDIKNNLYNGQASVQFSINSTSDDQRNKMFQNKSLSLEDIARLADLMPDPIGRKYCLNFAFATGTEINGKRLLDLFDPQKFMCKITPIHESNATVQNGIKTLDGYSSFAPYREVERSLIDTGFDVLVFIPSLVEEKSTITCGNAILGGSKIRL